MSGRTSRGPLAQLLVAWSPLSAILVLYAVAQWISGPLAGRSEAGGANRLGFGLHVSGPRRIDEAVFGVLPSRSLQQHLVDGSTHWYDAVAALVYVTHFVSIPLLTAFVWFRARERFGAWVTAVLAFTLIGVTGYVVYPAAPPWLGADDVERISRLGWHYLQLDPIARVSAIGQGGSNPVAAMPSLHAGAALLVSGFLWPLAHRWWRIVLATYVVLMGLTLLYTGEHYAVDVVAGWATAAAGLVVGAAMSRSKESSA